jgi:hypothetical protein
MELSNQKQAELREQEFKYLNLDKQKTRDIRGMENIIRDYRSYLTKLKSSWHWTITGPLRSIARYMERRRKKRDMRDQIKQLLASGLFDEEWYINYYPDVANDGVDPVEHYIRHGAMEYRNPSTLFDTRFYLDTYPDVAASGVNPLTHYITHGKKEGRKPRGG